MNKILIVEDEEMIRSELKTLLEQNGYQVELLIDFHDPVTAILKAEKDLILLDIKLPTMSGEYILKEMRKKSDIPIIVVTSQDKEIDEVISMSYGADDYITKPYHPTILLLHIEALLKRSKRSSTILSYRNIHLNLSKSLIEQNGQEYLLSKNECQIFAYLLEHQGMIVSRDDLMDHLWNAEEFIDDNTLTVNITRLKKKLVMIGLENVIETRRKQGYILI